MNDPKGSQWRKWDLHIHTPASFLWNGGKLFRDMNTIEEKNAIEEIINKIEKSDIAVFGVMDYWTFDGYCRIKRYLEEHKIELNKTIFPGMEIRVTAPTDFRLNLHFLLSSSITDQQLVDFKSRLEIRIGKDKKCLSEEALIDLARSYGDDKAKVHGFDQTSGLSDYDLWKLGSMTAEITIDSIEQALSVLPNKTALVLLPYDTSDGIDKLDWRKYPQSDNLFLKLANIFEARSQSIRDVIQGIRNEENEAFFENFQKAVGKPKPVVSGSDAHRVEDYGKYPLGKATWIKSDPTWAGLGIVLREPQDRCFIGKFPSQLLRVKDNQTKYIKKVLIQKEPDSNLDEVWFNNQVEFNSGLVAIIGNKGSGKSALIDILGLLSNSSRQTHFSFLNKQQFKQPNENKAKHFSGELVWESNNTAKKNLDDEPESTLLEITNYIPQDYFEIICNEFQGGNGSSFDRELKSVVFSHVEVYDRLGKASLDDLVNYRTTEITQKLNLLRRNLHRINQKIVEYEEQLASSYREVVENKLKGKKAELDAFDLTKPATVNKPKLRLNIYTTTNEAITSLENERESVKEEISKAKNEQAIIALNISKLEKIVERFDLFIKEFNEKVIESKDDLIGIGIDINKLVKVEFNKKPIEEKISALIVKKKVIDDKLDLLKKENLHTKLDNINAEIKKLHEKLDEPNKIYQQYKEELKEWKDKRSEIVGNNNELNTLKYYIYQLKELDSIPKKLNERIEERLSLVREIHQTIKQIAMIYSDLYGPVQQFISTHPLAKDKLKLIFDVSIINSNFPNGFFEFVHRGLSGSFYGADEGNLLLKQLVEKYDYSNEDKTIDFINEVNRLLHFINETGDEIKVKDQLRKDRELIDLYDFLFSLNYLEPRFLLKLENKKLLELSPGEKGALLLIFYLLIDKSDIPLLIDQPEHNLDNETIYDLLVPAIKEAKQKRQLIVVTHNPNIAVVCDADQIICASIDKSRGHEVGYFTGSIENPKINNRIIEVLEGTRPAFENRDDKYSLCWIND